MRVTQSIVLATLNRHKYQEFEELFAVYPNIQLIQVSDLVSNPNKLSFAEEYDTYLQNAFAKARLANVATHYPSLGDDSGLEVLALDGKPGIRSARFAPARPGISQDQANMEALLEQLPKQTTDMTARFVCTLALVVEGISIHATGTLEGELIRAPRGATGFGYDPIFVPKGQQKTLAEMAPSEKNAISHRAKAVQELMEQIKRHSIVLAKP
ncbi:MAG: hypothetical protein A2X94_12700 [Bdellovibrionales bacterium GWB1_55_8]|nr:MAG: hypothetical protein A2X94_12700 [Bdellovibrionales bacterium GWB1_55_8]